MLLADIGFGPFNAAWLGAALVITTPILLAAIGELISERAGVLNVGLEGMMLAGAFCAYLVTWKTDSIALGLAAGVGAGMAFAVIMALISIEARADQIVTGVGINLVALGLTTYGFDEIFGDRETVVLSRIGDLEIPLLSDIPGGIGPALFDQNPLVYITFLLVPATWYLLYRTKWGLSIRAAGEMPAAADTSGVSVKRVRWNAVLAAGFFAGLAGAYLVLVVIGIFRQEMTAGRGFLALVAVIFGRWHPFGVLGAALVLGGVDALQIRLATVRELPEEVWLVAALVLVAVVAYRVRRHENVKIGSPAVVTALGLALASAVLFVVAPGLVLPDQLWRAFPFALALVVLAGAVTRSRMPSHLTIPYTRE